MLDIQSLLEPVTVDAPGGTNLEYSLEYAELERALLGKPERQVGETTVAAEDPDWGAVIEKSLVLLRSSKDLRVATQLVRALLKRDAFAGLAQGLALVRQLVETYWPVLYPRLDEEDNDPTSRINTIAMLTHRDMLYAVRSAPLVKSKAFGVVTLRQIETASSRAGDGSTGGLSVEPALQGVPMADFVEATRAVAACESEARGLEAAWVKNLDAGGPDFTELRKVLGQANAIMVDRLTQRQASERADSNGAEEEAGAGVIQTGVMRGEPRSREDVVRALDGICAYYARNEPSSPVPLLLERCKRLVAMSFLDIVKDMVPDGLSTIQTIAGKRSE
jgi:type VI secretion system protein ImpA